MSVLILVPGFISFYLVWRGRIDTAFLSVYLPCLLVVPYEYSLRIPHLPPFSAAEFALIPLGSIGLMRLIRSGSFAFMDLLVFLYTASIGLSEILHARVLNNGIFTAMTTFVSLALAYTAGRMLIEPDLRLATVRRFVTLVLLNGPTSVWEWRMGTSPYGIFGHRVLGLNDISEGVQMRDGRGRIGLVFGGGECAGIAFAMTYCLNAWLVYLRRVKARVDLGQRLTKLEKYHVPGFLLLAYTFMTQSRGPEIALGAGFLILQIPRFKKIRLMMVLVGVLLVCGYVATKSYFASYASASEIVTEQQGSARYRQEMNEQYAPIADAGGLTGYGVPGIPHVPGKMSIDNHYLLVHLAWGSLGYYLFILIAIENVRVLIVRSWGFKAVEDRAFIIGMLAAMAVLWITLMTVFLGSQLPQIAFLLIGWIQSTKTALIEVAEPVEGARLKGFAFRRVFT
jgi:hypothetical protein